MAHILVTGAGGAAGISVLKALAGFGHTLCAVDSNPYAAGLYLVAGDRRATVSLACEPTFLRDLETLVARWSIDVIVPTVDEELPLVAAHRQVLAKLGAQVLVNPLSTITQCLDKWQLASRTRNCPTATDTWLCDEQLAAADLPYPVIIKPRTGRGSRGVRLVHQPNELASVPMDGTFIAQAYLPGHEYTVDVLAGSDGRIAAVVPRLRIEVSDGVAVTSETVQCDTLIRAATEVAQIVGARSILNVQFRRDAKGRLRLLEVNPRCSGTMSLTTAAGVNMPMLATDALLGAPLPMRIPFRPLVMVRFLEERFLDPTEVCGPARVVALEAA
jgi:carbamoyl-phosphate synthase large subunit